MPRFILACLPVTFAILLVLWCTAASAAVYEETCTRRPMVQGTVGEHVTTCELRRISTTIVSSSATPKARPVRPAKRTPVRYASSTTVTHYGVRYAAR